MSDTENIKINTSGGGNYTDRKLEKVLGVQNPTALYLAQKLLTSTTKYIKKRGLFSTEKSRLQKIQILCYRLEAELKKSIEYRSMGSVPAIMSYMSLISDTYPNWQDEYATLNRLIPLFY